jgi:2-oxoglutarate ferredoxin oxidoreductase subunit alpha
LQLITLFPFPRHSVEGVLSQCRVVLVPEMNMGQISREVNRVNPGTAHVRKYNRIDGQFMTPDEILSQLMKL